MNLGNFCVYALLSTILTFVVPVGAILIYMIIQVFPNETVSLAIVIFAFLGAGEQSEPAFGGVIF